MLSLQAQQHHNHIYKPITLASGSSEQCKKSLQRWTNPKFGKSSLDHTICVSWARWVYTRKIDGETGEPSAYKARWVAKGFSQIEGIDFNEHTKTQFGSSPLVNHLDLECDQDDIEAAFLNGDLEETIYLAPPEGSMEPDTSLASTSIEIDRHASFIYLNKHYLRQYLTDLTWLIAMLHGVLFHRFRPIPATDEEHAARHRAYPQATSAILYASTVSRPDLSQAAGVLSLHQQMERIILESSQTLNCLGLCRCRLG